MDNYAIADTFSLLAKIMDIHGENSFKSKTYAIAAFNIEKLPMELSDTPREKISTIKGIGESVSKKVLELLDTGELKTLTEYINKTPPGVLEMLRIKGIGPKKINTVWKDLEIESIGELLYACNENRLLNYKGFGEKTQTNIRSSIEFYLQNQGSYLYAQIESYALDLDKKLKQSAPAHKSELTGAFRRQLETIDELEWCTTIPVSTLKKLLSEGGFEVIEETDQCVHFKSAENIKVKFYASDEITFYYNLFNTSCSKEFLDSWNNVFHEHKDMKYVDEESYFLNAGLDYIHPFLREKELILSRAKDKKIPLHIKQSDVRGIIHCHSNWSDGVNTIEDLATECIKRGFEYLVISDHSKSAFYANGLSEERIREQQKHIDELNEKFKNNIKKTDTGMPFKIFKSIECDILNDGTMDYPDNILSTFDLVIASVHSNLKMTEEKATSRLLKTISNPYVTILGHMTGRLLLSRAGYPVDYKTIIDSCAENRVVIELNANPRRLDMDWRWIDYALEKGVLISIDPDSHFIEGFNDVKYGVLSAQKAGLPKEKNLSSFSVDQFEEFLLNRKRLKGIAVISDQ